MAKLNWRIVDRYFAGEATPTERELVERWLAESPAFRMLVAEIYRGAVDEPTVRRAQEEVRQRLQRAIAQDAAGRRPADPRRSPRGIVRAVKSRHATALKAAAAIALLLGGTLVVRQAAKIASVGRHTIGATYHTVAAPAGRRIVLSLPDGSQVMLSPGSTVRYARALNVTQRREIRLEGEAYFDVYHNQQQPFVVRAGDLMAEDLGTQFVVRAYPEDRYGRVVVRQGLVGLAGAVLSPGEIGWLSPNGKPVIERADTVSWFAWTSGRLVFNGMPLRDALPKLGRWYDLDFRLADSALGNARLVGTLPEQATDALNVIALVLQLQVTREGRVVTFRSR